MQPELALGISLHTVNAHRRNLLQRTGKANTAQLIRHAGQQGWIQNGLVDHDY